jgi:hypothetical protein
MHIYKIISFFVLIASIFGCVSKKEISAPKSLIDHINKVFILTIRELPRETIDLKLNKNSKNEIISCVYKATHAFMTQSQHTHFGLPIKKEDFFENDGFLLYKSLNSYKKISDLDMSAVITWQHTEGYVRGLTKDCFYKLYGMNVNEVHINQYTWDDKIIWAI